MSTQSTPILSALTEDLLIRVNEKLVQDSDRKIWRLICKEFHRVDSITRKTLRVLHVEFLLTLLKNYTNLHTLDLSVCPCIEDGTITLLLHRVGHSMWARNLKVLNLSRANGLKFSGLEMLVGACKGLESVDVSYCCGFGDREAAAISGCGGLKELRMDKCLGVSDVGLAKIVVGCGRLERLSLKWCMEISYLGVELLCKKCLELKFLDVSYLKVTSDWLRSIAALSKLEDLAMVGCPLVNDVGLQFLENGCPLLQKIDVSRCDCVSSSGLTALIRGHNGLLQIDAGYAISEFSGNFVECMQELKNLNAIIIDGAHVSDTIFQTISSNCKSLIEIGSSKCTGVTNMGIMQLVSGCVNLKTINLACCRSITDAAISAIADSCRNLLRLKLESCNMVTEKSLGHLGLHCALLEELDLTDCFGVNDRGLERLSRCSRLLCLKLGLCTNISDTGLFYIASKCSQLHELDLYRCMGIGDDGLAALSSGCKKLRKLNLSYCFEVTDKGMKSLGYLDELSDLELRALDKITGAGLAALVTRCKRLAYLDLKRCERVDDTGFWALAYYSRNLRQINLSYCSITDMALCMLMGNLTRLQDVDLVQLTNVTVQGFDLALRACCVRIKKKIDVSRCDCVSSSGLTALIRGHNGLLQIDAGYAISDFSGNFVECMQELKNLNAIIIDGARVSDTIFQTISSNCKSLIEIGLSKCTGVTNMGIMQLVSGCVNLKTINLTCCRSITDAAISAIADSCRNLLRLKLESCNMVTEKSLGHLGLHCALLEELDLTDCFGVNDRGLERLSRCSRLVCLKLGLCTNISDTGLFYIASKCSQLHELDLYRCMGIGDDGLAALSSGCKKLRKLNLSYCFEVTDKGMKSLGYLDELSDLELRALDKITGAGLAALVTRCKRLAYLDLKRCERVDDTGFWALAYYSRNLRQINLSYCSITDMALCMLMGNLTRLQDVDLVQLTNVTVQGFDLALRACCVRIKKVKLVAALGSLISSEVLGILHARGCRIRWD